VKPIATHSDVTKLATALAERDALIAKLQSTIASLQGTITALESALVNHASENEVLKRRLYGTKSERGGTSELQLMLGDLLTQQASLQKELEELAKKGDETAEPLAPAPAPPTVEKPRPKGRRDLSASSLPKILVEIRDAELEKTGKLIDWDVSYQLMRQRGGFKVLVKCSRANWLMTSPAAFSMPITQHAPASRHDAHHASALPTPT
jgi:hypothetical protein